MTEYLHSDVKRYTHSSQSLQKSVEQRNIGVAPEQHPAKKTLVTAFIAATFTTSILARSPAQLGKSFGFKVNQIMTGEEECFPILLFSFLSKINN